MPDQPNGLDRFRRKHIQLSTDLGHQSLRRKQQFTRSHAQETLGDVEHKSQ